MTDADKKIIGTISLALPVCILIVATYRYFRPSPYMGIVPESIFTGLLLWVGLIICSLVIAGAGLLFT
jgi:hypothetical protein